MTFRGGRAPLLETNRAESVKPGAPRLDRSELHLVAAPSLALNAAADVARRVGYPAHILGDTLQGESREVGTLMGGIAHHVATRGQPFAAPCVLLSGGETTVTLRGTGRGGPNMEFLLALAIELNGLPNVYALAADTDGVDGVEDVAGALCGPDTLGRAAALAIDPRQRLADNDSLTFFEGLGDQLTTGPTVTNVNDFRAILVDRADTG